MKTIEISDELFDELKSFVVDPFDDTPDAVIARLVEIVNKAKRRWSPLETHSPAVPSAQVTVPKPQRIPTREECIQDEESVVLL